MRSILALSLLIALCGVANAAPAHHTHRHAVVRSNQGTFAPGSASSFAYAPSSRRSETGPASGLRQT